MKLKTFIIGIALLLGCNVHAQMFFGEEKAIPDSIFNSLAQTPPMGWNSWNKFGCNVSEDLIKEMADAMVESGMKDAGYEYIVIEIYIMFAQSWNPVQHSLYGQTVECRKKILISPEYLSVVNDFYRCL